MCESKALIVKNGREELLMEDVTYLETTPQELILVNIKGEKLVLKNHRISKIDFLKHRIYLEPIA